MHPPTCSRALLLWQRAYEGTSGDWGSRTIELADNDPLISGIWAWGFAGEDIWLQRTDAEGLIGDCDLIRDTAVTTIYPAGEHEVHWNISQRSKLPEGTYYFALYLEGELHTRSAVLVR